MPDTANTLGGPRGLSALPETSGIEARIDALRASGLLTADCPVEASDLRDVAAVDLSLGRLYEGHVNAMLLIRHHAAPAQRRRYLDEAAGGRLFGVWGADDSPPVTASGDRLSGAKRFASGLGLVDRAIVTAGTEDGQRLLVVEAGDPDRQDLSGWDMAGMQDSRSGRFDCDGLRGDPLGPPGIYTAEPHFLGGTWRIAAVTLGATSSLLDRAATLLRATDRLEAEAQLLRLAPLATRIVAAWPAIRRAGAVAEGPAGRTDPERAATLSVSVRLLTEALAQDTIAAVERSVGLAMFANVHPVGRAARDLACYVRQATPDAFALRVGRAMLATPQGLEGWLDD